MVGCLPGGHFVGTLFFLLLLFAAYTTALAMLEPTISWLEEKFSGGRRRLTVITGGITWILGIGSVLSFSVWEDIYPLGFLDIEMNIFGLADFTVANIILPVNAFLIAAFCGWGLKQSSVDEEFTRASLRWKTWWRVTNRYIAPIAIAIVLVDLVRG